MSIYGNRCGRITSWGQAIENQADGARATEDKGGVGQKEDPDSGMTGHGGDKEASSQGTSRV